MLLSKEELSVAVNFFIMELSPKIEKLPYMEWDGFWKYKTHVKHYKCYTIDDNIVIKWNLRRPLFLYLILFPSIFEIHFYSYHELDIFVNHTIKSPKFFLRELLHFTLLHSADLNTIVSFLPLFSNLYSCHTIQWRINRTKK